MPGVGRAATLAAAPAERSWRRVSSLVIVGSRPCSVAPVASGGRGAFHPAHGVVCSKDSFVDRRRHALDETRSEEHTSELQSRLHLVCRLLLEKKNHGWHPPQSTLHPIRRGW